MDVEMKPATSIKNIRRFYGLITIVVLIALAVVLFNAFVITIPAGYVGVVYDKTRGGILEDHVLTQGWKTRIPIIQSVQLYPVATKTYVLTKASTEGSPNDDSLNLPTVEGQNVNVDVALSYYVKLEKAPAIYTKFKGADIDSIEKTYIRRMLVSTAQNVTGKYSILDIYGAKREEIQNAIQAALKRELEPIGFAIDKFTLGELRMPPTIEESIKAKIDAAQRAQQAESELARAKVEAEQKKVEAQGRAEALLTEARAEAEANRIIAESLTPELIQLKAIEKLNPNVQMVVPADSRIFMGDLFKANQEKK